MRNLKLLNSFFNDYTNSFLDQFEMHMMKKVENREDYKVLRVEEEDLLVEYPNVQHYLEDDKIMEMTNKEKEVILRILRLNKDMKSIEIKEAFKLGAKEMYIFFQEMDMLNTKKKI